MAKSVHFAHLAGEFAKSADLLPGFPGLAPSVVNSTGRVLGGEHTREGRKGSLGLYICGSSVWGEINHALKESSPHVIPFATL